MNMLKSLWGRITRKGADEGTYPVQQATYLDRVSDVFVLFPYGMHGNLPVDQLGLLIDQQGRIFMGTSAVGRITVEEGEVVFYHPKTNSKIHFKDSGDLDIDAKNVTITTSEDAVVNAAGDASVTAGGAVDVQATGNVTLTAPTVAVVGNLTVSGTVVSTGEMTANGITFSDHTHPYTWTDGAGSGDTGAPN